MGVADRPESGHAAALANVRGLRYDARPDSSLAEVSLA